MKDIDISAIVGSDENELIEKIAESIMNDFVNSMESNGVTFDNVPAISVLVTLNIIWGYLEAKGVEEGTIEEAGRLMKKFIDLAIYNFQ